MVVSVASLGRQCQVFCGLLFVVLCSLLHLSCFPSAFNGRSVANTWLRSAPCFQDSGLLLNHPVSKWKSLSLSLLHCLFPICNHACWHILTSFPQECTCNEKISSCQQSDMSRVAQQQRWEAMSVCSPAHPSLGSFLDNKDFLLPFFHPQRRYESFP